MDNNENSSEKSLFNSIYKINCCYSLEKYVLNMQRVIGHCTMYIMIMIELFLIENGQF